MSPEENKNLGQCHACLGTVSKKAKTCPHCGEKKPFRGRKKLSPLVSWSIIIFATLIGIGMISGVSAPPAPPDSSGGSSGYPESESRQMCERAIRASLNNPSTLKIHGISGYATNVDSSGTRRITQSFSAKNGFGLQLTYDAYCIITPDGQLDIKVAEQGG